MLDQLLFLLFLHPAYPETDIKYKSGISEVEHSYESDRPATDFPMLTIDVMTQDSEYNILPAGIYAVDVRPDLKELIIMQGHKVLARSQVIQVIELGQKLAVPSVEVGFIKNNIVFIIYKKEDLELHGILYRTGDLPAY